MKDFTTGPVFPQLIRFTVPMFLANVLQGLYVVVSAVWVGRLLGSAAFAAVSMSAPIIFLLVSGIIGFTIAATVLVAQAYGARNDDYLGRVLVNSLLGCGALAVLVSVAGTVFAGHLLRLIGTPGDILDPARTFLAVSMAGLVFTFLYNWFGGMLRGLGDAKTPLILLLFSTVLNIALDPLFIRGFGAVPRMGVAGAALGAVVANAVMCVVAYVCVLRRHPVLDVRRWMFRIDGSVLAKLAVIGGPVALQMSVASLAGVFIMSLVSGFGPTVIAGAGIGLRLDQFAVMPAMAIGMSVSSMVAQNLGAGRAERVREITRLSVLFTIVSAAAMSAAGLLFPHRLAALFTDDPTVIAATVSYLRIVACSYITFSLMFTLQGVVRGAGDTLKMLGFSVIGLIGVRYPLAWALSRIPALGERGIWWGIAASTLVGFGLNAWYYLSGRWRRVRLVPQGAESSPAIAASPGA